MLLATSVPPISRLLYDKLVQTFPPVVPVPNFTTMEDIMFSAGQQHLLAWLEQHVQGAIIVGSTNVIVKPNDR